MNNQEGGNMDDYDYQGLVNEVVQRGINLFGSFEEWTKGALALADLGEDGRSMFKAISSISDKYIERENDYKFNNALQTRGRITIATFIYMCQKNGIDTNKYYVKDVTASIPCYQARAHRIPKDIEYGVIDKKFLLDSLDYNLESDFVSFLKPLINDDEKTRKIVKDFHLGLTDEKHIIYWYVDKDDAVRYGKVMAYKPDGHRDHSLHPQSVSCELLKKGLISTDFIIKKTLFGEHLLRLPENKVKTIGIVEAEKTAVICSLCLPDILWMATGSLYNMQQERFEAVKHYSVILFPDTDDKSEAFNQWSKRAEEMNQKGWHIHVSDYLERIATPEQRTRKIDVGDLLIDELMENKRKSDLIVFGEQV